MRNFLFFSAISYNFLTIPEKDFLVGQRYGIYETEDFDKEGRDGNRKGDRCMSRDDKRIKKEIRRNIGRALSEGDGRAGLASGGDDTSEIHLS